MLIGKKMLMKLYNLKNLIRYNQRFRITNETVAEHSYFTGLFTTLLCKYYEVDLETENKAIKYALLHDIPEIEISDVPYSTKQLSAELVACLTKMEYKAVKEILPDLYKDFENIHGASNFENKNNIKAKIIVDIADVLSVLQYCFLEKSLGNSHMDAVLLKTYERLDFLNYMSQNVFGKEICIDSFNNAKII